MLSNYLSSLLEKLHFFKVVTARFLIILFRRKKGIELLYLDYNTEHLFDNSYLIINYRFRNALYYRFKNIKTLEKQIKIFDLKNFDNEFDLVVYGFFQKKKYQIKVERKLELDNSNFKTSIFNLNLKLSEITIPRLTHQNIYCSIHKPIITKLNIEIENKKLAISNTIFNQNEFI